MKTGKEPSPDMTALLCDRLHFLFSTMISYKIAIQPLNKFKYLNTVSENKKNVKLSLMHSQIWTSLVYQE